MHIYYSFTSILKKAKKQFALFIVLFVLTLQAFAQVPLNDDPCLNPSFPGTGAINLVASAACSYATFTNVDASNSTGTGIPNPTCANFTDADVWFTTTVPVGATAITVDTRNLGMTDGGMSIYTATGTCPTLTMTELSCADGGSANPSMPKLTVNQPAGTVLYIRVWGFGGETGTFGICVTANIPPANDNCENAQLLTVNANLLCPVVTAGTTNNATQSTSTPNPPCGVANAWNDDVWFSFVATGVAHRVSLLNVSGSSTNMVMNVYNGTCAALTQVACLNGNALDIGGLTVGTTYYVRVYTNVTSTATANFNICVGTPPPPPANDECLNAVSLTVNPNYNCAVVTAGTTVSATTSATLPTPTCGATGINDDVWFSFVATSTGHRVSLLNVAGTVTDMVMTIYSGNCTALTQVVCSDPDIANLTGLTIGTTYYVRVYTFTATVGSNASFNICVGTPPPPPANDECPNATSLPVNPDFNCALVTAGTTISATQSANLPAPTCSTTGINDDVWYTFTTTATSTAHRITLTSVVPVNTMGIATYSGTCAALVQNGCSTTGVLNLAGLTPSTTYYVRVFTTSATVFVESNFNICVGTPPPPPANDDCITAIPAPVNPNYLCGLVTAGTVTSATATTGVPAPSCNATGANDDIWFSFVATNASQRISFLNIVGTTTLLTSVIYSGACASLTELSCNATNLYNATGFTPGNTYYIRIFTTTATIAQEVNFNLCIGTPPPPPANDNCAGAISLTVNSNQLCAVTTAGTTAGATQSATTPTPTCGPANSWDDDVWYSFVAVSNNHTVSLLNVTGLSTDMLTTVYSGTCAALIQIACVTTDPNVINLNTLTPGNTYYVRVQTELTGVDANFSICVGTPGPGAVCGSGVPFCSTAGVSYPSVTNQPSLGTIDCLLTTPNPTWFYFQVSNPGNLQFQISQTNTAGVGIDVDFAAWGPFTSQTAGCTSIAANPVPTIDCSYSTAAIETVDIPGALAGQWYVVLITNFNGGAGTISFNTTPESTGSTNCNIVCNTIANNNGPVCLGGSFNLTATALSGATTYAWTGPNGFTSTAQNPTGITAPTTPGNYVYSVTTTSGTVSCAATTNLIVVTTPIAPIVVTPVTYCQNATAIALTATVLANHTAVWYTVPTGGTGITTAPIPSTTAIGSTTYYVSQKIGLCEGPRVPIVVNIIVSTTPAVEVISPVAYCQGVTTVSLAASAMPMPSATLLWYATATGGSSSTIAPIPSSAVPGSTAYYVSQIIGSCEGPRTPIVVNVTAYSPSPTVLTPVNYCQGTTTVALSATGTNLLWYTIATGGTGSAIVPIPSSATTGTTVYYVTQTSNGCPSLRVPITVNVFANPATPIVTSPVVYCQNATPIALTATGTGLTWFTVPSGGTALPGAPTPSTTAVGSTTYYVQANNGTCFSPRASIIVTVNITPVAPTVTSPVVYCQLATATALTAAGTNLLWYTTSTGGTGSATAPTPITTAVGTTNYYVSATTGICEGPRALIAVTVNATPLAPTVTSPVNYCQNATASPLTATPNIGTLVWYTSATGGTGSATAPTPSTTTAGSTIYYVSSIVGICEGPRTALTVTVTATPALPIVITPVTYCTNVTPVALTATGNNLLWYTNPAGGIGSTTAPTPSTTTAGTTPYYVSQSTSGVVCEGPRALINVVINPRPVAPTVVSPIPYCQNVNALVLTASATAGNTLSWYTVPTAGTGSASAPVPSTGSVGSTIYYVSQTTPLGCEGARNAITVNVTPVLTINAGNDTIMARGNTIQLRGISTGVPAATYLWTANVAPLSLTSATILNPLANPIQTTIYTLRANDPSGLCPSVTDQVRVEVVQSCINIKNAFTPNGDGVNDTWFVYDQNFCLTNPGGARVTVFNRYGSKVFESQDYANRWDGTYKGKPLPDGTYYAVIEFTLFDGKKQYNKTDVTILR
jgi:gliding motility-associated-like protein